MLVAPFTSEFYTIFPAPNADEFIDLIDQACKNKDINNDHFDWGSKCIIDRIPLSWEMLLEYFIIAKLFFLFSGNLLVKKISNDTIYLFFF